MMNFTPPNLRLAFAKYAVAASLLCAPFNQMGCVASGLRPPPVSSGEQDDTSVGPGDIFDVRVYGEPDLTSNYRVDEAGTIDFPYLGRVEVAGAEPTEIAERLEGALRTQGVLVNPQVSILITEYNSKRITITGAVRSPGNFPMSPGLTVVQAINLAGGFTDLANRNAAILRRQVNGEVERFALRIDDITRGGAPDHRVRSGDIIFVPERPF